jgi:hypothetical protein
MSRYRFLDTPTNRRFFPDLIGEEIDRDTEPMADVVEVPEDEGRLAELEAEVGRLKKALEAIRDHHETCPHWRADEHCARAMAARAAAALSLGARAALKGGEE